MKRWSKDLWLWRSIFLCAAVFTLDASADESDAIYTEFELQQAAQLYSRNLQGIWLQDLGGELTQDERQVARQIDLLLPLVGQHGHPFDFYADPGRLEVTIPILSVKFMDDLSIALAWLETRGCDTQSAFDYISMLRYQSADSLPNRRFQPPRLALGVPDNVLSNATIDDLSQKILKSAIYFIMAHELAHVLYEHASYASISPDVAQQQEMEADFFALNLMRRISVPPVGIVFFFSATSRIDPDHLRTHPLSSQRVQAVADYIQQNARDFTLIQSNPAAWLPRIEDMATNIREIARLLNDSGVRAMQRARGEQRSFQDLANSCPR